MSEKAGASIKYWPEEERPRERLLRHGPEALTDGQLLAVLLRTGDARRSAMGVARDLLGRFDNLRALGGAGVAEMAAVPGIGPAKAAQIMAALELGRRVQAQPLQRGTPLRGSRDVFEACVPYLRDLKKEIFQVVLLNGKNCVLRTVTISTGSLTSCLVHPREVFAPAIRESSASVLLVHNHPSGDPTPSREDMALNGRLVKAGEVIGIPVLDHLVIGDGRYVSFVDEGLMMPRPPVPRQS